MKIYLNKVSRRLRKEKNTIPMLRRFLILDNLS